jgi:hypothetical protein
MKTLDLKRKIEKLSGDFKISAGDVIAGPNGQPVVGSRSGSLEDVVLRYIDMYRGKTPAETRSVFSLGKRIRDATGTVHADDTEFEYLTKVFDVQIAPVVDAFYSMVEELNPEA